MYNDGVAPQPSNPHSPIIITIDGPAGSGKTTTARYFAQHYRVTAGGEEQAFSYLSSGLFYRVSAAVVLQRLDVPQRGGQKAQDATHVLSDGAFSESTKTLLLEKTQAHYADIAAGMEWKDGALSNQLLQGAQPLDLHGPEVSAAAAVISTYAPLREALGEKMRKVIQNGNWVIEGRDAGTRIAPFAYLKIYLDVDSETRAARRYKEYSEIPTATHGPRAGAPSPQTAHAELSQQDVQRQLAARDAIDMNKGIYSLYKADDAVQITVQPRLQTVEQICDKIYNILIERLKQQPL